MFKYLSLQLYAKQIFESHKNIMWLLRVFKTTNLFSALFAKQWRSSSEHTIETKHDAY